MPRALAPVLAMVVLAAVPAAAQAKSYKGKTNQGKVATVTTGADGVVTKVRVVWSAKCRTGLKYRESTTFKAPIDAATGDMVQDAGTYKQRLVRGYIGHITISVSGQRDPAADRWSGSLTTKVRVTSKGKTIDRCNATVSWKAR